MLVHYGIEHKLIDERNIFALSVKLKTTPSSLRRILEERALLMGRVKDWDINDLVSWLQKNDQTTQNDNQKGLGVYFLKDWAERLSAETYLEKLNIIPDYKNNKQLLVIDLNKIIYQLSQKKEIKIEQLIKDFFKKAKIESEKFDELSFRANPTEKFREIIKEQAEKRIGIKTTEMICFFLKQGHKGQKI